MPAKLTYEYVKIFIESFEGYKLLSNNYKDSHAKILIQCPNNHIFEMKFNDFQQGHRCSKCKSVKKHTFSEIKQYVQSFKGYELISKEYKNSKEKLKIKCPNNHIFEIKFNDFQQGHRCIICRDNFQRYSYEQVKQIIECANGYKLISKEYKNSNYKLSIECPVGHIFEMRFGGFHFGHRCPVCSKEIKYSRAEREIFEYVKKIHNGVVIQNDRNQIINPKTNKRLELDIWLPHLNKAIEYNGEYWHSLENVKIIDEIKKEQCKIKNIDLLIIQESDWVINKNWSIIDSFVKFHGLTDSWSENC
jgi:hypothetical protein